MIQPATTPTAEAIRTSVAARAAQFPDFLLTTEEMSLLTGFEAATLKKWRHTRRYDLPYVKQGHHVRYRYIDYLEWAKRHTVAPAAP